MTKTDTIKKSNPFKGINHNIIVAIITAVSAISVAIVTVVGSSLNNSTIQNKYTVNIDDKRVKTILCNEDITLRIIFKNDQIPVRVDSNGFYILTKQYLSNEKFSISISDTNKLQIIKGRKTLKAGVETITIPTNILKIIKPKVQYPKMDLNGLSSLENITSNDKQEVKTEKKSNLIEKENQNKATTEFNISGSTKVGTIITNPDKPIEIKNTFN